MNETTIPPQFDRRKETMQEGKTRKRRTRSQIGTIWLLLEGDEPRKAFLSEEDAKLAAALARDLFAESVKLSIISLDVWQPK